MAAGMPNSPVVYFHGIPGSSHELKLFQEFELSRNELLYVPNRSTMNLNLGLSAFLDKIALDVEDKFPNGCLHFVGFSLGAYIALEVVARLGSKVSSVDLISAAAPLSLGSFLHKMAGRPVFSAAQQSPVLFGQLAWGQAMVANFAPNVFFDLVFRSAQGEDRELAANVNFRRMMIVILNECFGRDTVNYRREIMGYAADWSALLSSINQPVRLWHGSMDNWAPPEMATALVRSLPNVTSLKILSGKSHYSTLRQYLVENPYE
jgi:pimeloyl-ACP methyl ester carboxylesterase